MKISIPGIACLLALSFMICCKKSNDGSGPSKTIQVTEYKSNKPLAGAVVLFYKWVLNPISGGYFFMPIDSAKTNINGVCKISESVFNLTAMLGITKDNYLPYEYRENPLHTTEFSIDIIAHLKLHLIDTSALPINTSILLSVTSERFGMTSNPSFKTVVGIYPIPVDTTMTLDVFGGQKNAILLNFLQIDGLPVPTPSPFPLDVNRDGITELEIKY